MSVARLACAITLACLLVVATLESPRVKETCFANAATPNSILVVLPTWVGDFVMATPTLRAIRNRFAEARITFLMHPNLRELVRGGDWMDECVEWPEGNVETQKHRNAETGKRQWTWWELRRTLRSREFDWAIVLPNSFRSAWIAWLSGAKRRIGYARDGRSFLLTDRIAVRNLRRLEDRSSKFEVRNQPLASARGSDYYVPSIQTGAMLPVRLGRYVPMPLVEYYADLAEAIGCERPGDRLELFTTSDCDESVQRRLGSLGVRPETPSPYPLPQGGRGILESRPNIADRHPLIVISPGAKFGASKCWLPERFAAVADRLIESGNATIIVTCGPGEESIARSIGAAMKNYRAIGPSPRPSDPPGPSLLDRLVRPSVGSSDPWKGEGAGAFVFDDPLLTLGELKSLIRRSDLLICNDAGPRHFAKAFDVPVVTVFGPTHPDWTSTSYEKERIVRIDVDCGPCQQRVCPLGHHQCMTGVTEEMVFDAASSLLRTYVTHHAESH